MAKRSEGRAGTTAFGGRGMGVGIAIGIAIGVAIGVAMDNIGAGIAIGVAIGIAFGTAFNARGRSDDADPTLGSGPDGERDVGRDR